MTPAFWLGLVGVALFVPPLVHRHVRAKADEAESGTVSQSWLRNYWLREER